MIKLCVQTLTLLTFASQAFAQGLPTSHSGNVGLPGGGCTLKAEIEKTAIYAVPPGVLVTATVRNTGLSACPDSVVLRVRAGDLIADRDPVESSANALCTDGDCVTNQALAAGADVRVQWVYRANTVDEANAVCVSAIAETTGSRDETVACPVEPCALTVGAAVSGFIDGQPRSQRYVVNECTADVHLTTRNPATVNVTPLSLGVSGGVVAAGGAYALDVRLAPDSQIVLSAQPGCVDFIANAQLSTLCF